MNGTAFHGFVYLQYIDFVGTQYNTQIELSDVTSEYNWTKINKLNTLCQSML